VVLARIYGWLAGKELIDQEGKYQGILHVLATYESTLYRCYDRLGLNAESRKRLAVLRGREDWAKVLSASPAEDSSGDSGGDPGGEAVGDDR
jgi:hypothetical protein